MSTGTSQLFTLEPPYELAFPGDSADLGLESSATAACIDFTLHPPATLYVDDSLDEALSFLSHAHVSVMAVVDRHGHFRGLVTRDQLSDESAMRLLALGQHRKELQVRDLMVPRSQLMAIDHDTLANTSVGKLVSLLHREGQPHILVVDRDSQQIRGLISAVELARRLNLPLDEVQPQPTFVDIFKAVMH